MKAKQSFAEQKRKVAALLAEMQKVATEQRSTQEPKPKGSEKPRR
ncbi:hypothetical protein [Crenobacter intestini]|nr:hypothetical protein [Crenobacter intestini]